MTTLLEISAFANPAPAWASDVQAPVYPCERPEWLGEDEAVYEPTAEDREWLAGITDDAVDREAEALDRLWLEEEAARMARYSERSDVAGDSACAAGVLGELARLFRFHRHGSASAFLADPNSGVDRSEIDRVAIVGRHSHSPFARKGRLARALDATASYWLCLDTTVAAIAAVELVRLADSAELLGADTYEEYDRLEAEARVEAVAEINATETR